MLQFCFYYGDNPQMAQRMRQACSAQWAMVTELHRDKFWLFGRGSASFVSMAECAGAVGAVSGYVRRDGFETLPGSQDQCERMQLELFLSEVMRRRNWPLDNTWTGSFACAVYGPRERSIVLCNDVLGYLPIYWTQRDGALAGGTSLVLIGRTMRCRPDPVGVLQRTRCPNCNYGRRTPLRGVEQLLPGEWIEIADDSRIVARAFDNTLCREVITGSATEVAGEFWRVVRTETSMALGKSASATVALSGGWDSRIVLNAAAQHGAVLRCCTYGEEDAYEPGIARRCAASVGAVHHCFSIQNKLFPERKAFEQLVRDTEAANFMVWYTVIEGLQQHQDGAGILLLGDHCESADGRNMSEISSRMSRVQSFLGALTGSPDAIAPSAAEAFERWKWKKEREILDGLACCYNRLADSLAAVCPLEMALEETRQDLQFCFRRVEEHQPPFVPMYDELFSWFHRSRFSVASQNLLLSAVGRVLSPAMSMRSLRFASRLHPAIRMRRRLIDAVAKLRDFEGLGRLPSAQIPWIGSRGPAWIREMIWGVRSGVDQVLIRRMLRTKRHTRWQRVLKSLDWVPEYRRVNTPLTVGAWFSGNWIKPDKYLEKVIRRAALDDWPCMNDDIAASANTSVILDLSQQAIE